VTIATATTRQLHHVRLLHSSTGLPVGPLSARLVPPTFGWHTRVVTDGAVVIGRTEIVNPAAPPKLVLTVTDGRAADMLVIPPAAGQPARTVLVDLTKAEIEKSLHPVPMTLQVALVLPSTGKPATGRALVAKAKAGANPKPTIPLAEVEPGIYQSNAVEWTARFTPFDLLVGAKLLRTLSIDLTSTSTSIRLVDTT